MDSRSSSLGSDMCMWMRCDGIGQSSHYPHTHTPNLGLYTVQDSWNSHQPEARLSPSIHRVTLSVSHDSPSRDIADSRLRSVLSIIYIRFCNFILSALSLRPISPQPWFHSSYRLSNFRSLSTSLSLSLSSHPNELPPLLHLYAITFSCPVTSRWLKASPNYTTTVVWRWPHGLQPSSRRRRI